MSNTSLSHGLHWLGRVAAGSFVFVVMVFSGALSAGASSSLPLALADITEWRPLSTFADPHLEEQLRLAITRQPSWAKLARNEKLAVGLVDLTDPSHPRLAMVNGLHTMYAASLPKIAVLYAGVRGLETGLLPESPTVLEDLQAMIQQSSNVAATRVIRGLGFEYISSALTHENVALYDEELGGGLWVGRAYSKNSERRPDPVARVTHGANVFQVCRFYYLLSHGRLVDRERSRQMLDLLSNTSLKHKFVHHLDQSGADLTRVYRKSGTWRQWHSDSMLVWDRGRRYILVALVEDPNGETFLRELPPTIERILRRPRLALE